MTRKLYDLDSHRRDFSAIVLRCDPDGARYAVVLDQTVFFPEGGGQPADTGVLGGARVLDVQLLPAVLHSCCRMRSCTIRTRRSHPVRRYAARSTGRSASGACRATRASILSPG